MNSNVIFYFSQTKNYKILTGQKASEKKTLIFNSPTQKVKSYLEPLSTLLVLCTKQLKWKNFFLLNHIIGYSNPGTCLSAWVYGKSQQLPTFLVSLKFLKK